MFETISMAPPDPILGLTEAFRKDSNPDKINLSVGVYKDSQGNTPLLGCVQEAKKRLLERERGQGYLGIDGLPEFTRLARELLFCPQGDAASHEALASGRAVTAQTPGCLLSQSALRQIPLAEIERAAFKTDVIEPTPQAIGRGPQSGMALTDDDLQAVADAYITARNQRIPVQAFVATQFGVALSTAAKRIAAARRRGFITPDTPPK